MSATAKSHVLKKLESQIPLQPFVSNYHAIFGTRDEILRLTLDANIEAAGYDTATSNAVNAIFDKRLNTGGMMWEGVTAQVSAINLALQAYYDGDVPYPAEALAEHGIENEMRWRYKQKGWLGKLLHRKLRSRIWRESGLDEQVALQRAQQWEAWEAEREAQRQARQAANSAQASAPARPMLGPPSPTPEQARSMKQAKQRRQLQDRLAHDKLAAQQSGTTPAGLVFDDC